MSESERYLQRLCEKTFLGLWTYPNPFYNAHAGQDGNEKELCDAAVVFGRKVLLISDKVASLPLEEENALVLWKRWYRRTVVHSMRQLEGATRMLKVSPRSVFTDETCSRRLFLDEEISKGFQVHRIIVVRGAAEASRLAFGGGFGSLGVQTIVDPLDDDEGHFLLFGNPFSRRRVLHHVLNDSVLEIVLSELDTVTDFVKYLEAKERLFSTKHVIAAGEEDILAEYLRSTNPESLHDFVLPQDGSDYDCVQFAANAYASRLDNQSYQRMKAANEKSYFVDWLLHVLCGAPEAAVGQHIARIKPSVGDLAGLSRVERRVVGERFVNAIAKTPAGAYRFSGGWGLFSGENPINALVLNLPEYDEATTKELAAGIFEAYIARFVEEGFNTWTRWNCILFDKPRFDVSRRVSLYSVERSELTLDRIASGRQLADKLGLVTKMDFVEFTEKEYPEIGSDGQPVSTLLKRHAHGVDGLRQFTRDVGRRVS